MSKNYSGFTEKTPENLLLDAGAFFINYNLEEDTFENAVTEGKLLGATRGGGSFVAEPEIRKIEVDGVKGAVKGLSVIDSWEVKMTANILEITKDGLAKALTASKTDAEANEDYVIITAKNQIELGDYIENITWVGALAGSDKPAIIQIFNVLNSTGLTLETQDKDEAVISMEFEGHYAMADLERPPFAIYYPKKESVED